MKRVSVKSAAVWALFILAEVVNGILRVRFLEPIVGDFRARQIAVIPGSAVILIISFLSIRWIGAGSAKELLAVGLLWLGLTLVFEISLGYFVFIIHGDAFCPIIIF